MTEFLSPEWIAEFTDATSGLAVDPGADDGAVVLVIGAGDTAIGLRATIRAGRMTVEPSPAGDSDVASVVVRCDIGTAVAIASGRTNAQSELAAGRLRLAGDVRVLPAFAAASAAIGTATRELRARTSFPAP